MRPRLIVFHFPMYLNDLFEIIKGKSEYVVGLEKGECAYM